MLFAPAIRLNQFLEILHFTEDKNAEKTGEKLAASASKKSTSDLAGYLILYFYDGCQPHLQIFKKKSLSFRRDPLIVEGFLRAQEVNAL